MMAIRGASVTLSANPPGCLTTGRVLLRISRRLLCRSPAVHRRRQAVTTIHTVINQHRQYSTPRAQPKPAANTRVRVVSLGHLSGRPLFEPLPGWKLVRRTWAVALPTRTTAQCRKLGMTARCLALPPRT